jgi:hypothetical protein
MKAVQAAESLGARRVRKSFNPSDNHLVEQLKADTAELIDLCAKQMDAGQGTDGEAQRLWSLAMTHYEDAAMWAVKAATSG